MQPRYITIESNFDPEDAIGACEKAFPWIVSLHHSVFVEEETFFDLRKFHFELFEFPGGISRRRAEYRLRAKRWQPAEPIHMLALATQHPELIQQSFGPGVYHNYIVGLGGDFQTVLGAQFGGLGTGMTYFFTQLSCRKWKHAGGKPNRFLGVRPLQ